MNDAETRRYETFINVREFGLARPSQFPAASLAAELLTRLRTVIDDIERNDSAFSSGRRTAQQGSRTKSVARDELRNALEAISRTARSMALTTPGLEDKFRVPRRRLKDQELLSIARSFAADAAPLEAEFVRRGMPERFLDFLGEDIEDFERAINQTILARETHVAANAAIDDLIEDGMNIVRELDAIMRNTFADDPATLAAWTSASHIERAPRSSSSKPPAPPAPQP
ncbi:MAG TPA: hypothetical protein VE842_01125 [Pyrinomonadaceae bacterium]|jgi:hypothetical protein|nr:hypothetical protein [Pyrinomonadaceae bacterium]